MRQSTPPASGDALRGLEGPRLLVVGDDAVMVESLWRVIRWLRPGWRAELAVGQQGAEAALAEQRFDAAVVDVDLYRSGGAGTLEWLRTHVPELVRVAHCPCTSRPHLELHRSHAVVCAPTSPEEFVRTIDQAIEDQAASGATA